MKIDVRINGETVIADVLIADTFWTRLSGYMFRKSPHVSGILFEGSNAIQTTFMCFDLDLFFLTKENRVVKILRNVRPWRQTWFYLSASKTLETPAGVISPHLKEGDVLEFSLAHRT